MIEDNRSARMRKHAWSRAHASYAHSALHREVFTSPIRAQPEGRARIGGRSAARSERSERAPTGANASLRCVVRGQLEEGGIRTLWTPGTSNKGSSSQLAPTRYLDGGPASHVTHRSAW